MKKFIVIMTFQKIPIWVELISSLFPPDLKTLNQTLGMFGDGLFVRKINGNINPRTRSFI